MDPDHYLVLGLPSGEEGARLSEKEIARAYRIKALELHPDKRPDDRDAQANFQKLKASYEILKDAKARKQFDDLVRAKREQTRRRYMREEKYDARRARKMSDIEIMENRYASERMKARREKEEEERTFNKLQAEIAEIRAKHKRKMEEEFAQKAYMHPKRGRSATAAAAPPPPHFRKETEDGPWKDPARFLKKGTWCWDAAAGHRELGRRRYWDVAVAGTPPPPLLGSKGCRRRR